MEKNLQDVVEFHGHLCPGLALGYRAARAALREMRLAQPEQDEELVAIAENDSCAVDAIQVITGCTLGKGNLFVKDYGKQVYTFARRPSGQGIRIAVVFEGMAESEAEKEMWRRYQDGDRSEEVVQTVHSRKARKVEAILEAPEQEICNIRGCTVDLPAYARLHQTLRCQVCDEKVAEPKMRVRHGRMVCIPCAEAE